MSDQTETAAPVYLGTELLSLKGKSIIVTGAGRGIGKGIALQALSLGASVTAVDLDADPLHQWTKEYDSDKVNAVIGSVTDEDFVKSLVEDVDRRFGSIDGLVNNAGIIRPAMIQKMTLQQWQAVIDVNLTGVYCCLQAVGSYLVERVKAGGQAGSIVNISSDGGRRGTIGQINYGAAKSGVLGITMCAAREWAQYGVRVNSVCFGVVETPMTSTILSDKFRDRFLAQIPMGRWAQPEEVAPPVCFLLARGSSYMTGQHISVNGGYHIGF